MPKFNEYPTEATPTDDDTMLIFENTSKKNKQTPFSGLWNWMVGKLTNAVIDKLTTENKTVLGALNELNSKSFKVSNTVSDVTQLDEMSKTQILYASVITIKQKSVYGFVFTAAYYSVVSQLIFGSFNGVSGIAVRSKSGNPLQWKDWKLL